MISKTHAASAQLVLQESHTPNRLCVWTLMVHTQASSDEEQSPTIVHAVPLERMYARIGVHLGRYGVRISPHVPRFFPAATVTRRDAVIAPNAPNHMNTFLQLLQLDSSETPGLSEVEFGNLFRKCRFCGTIVTRRAQQYHSCIEFPPVAIIDLTLDD